MNIRTETKEIEMTGNEQKIEISRLTASIVTFFADRWGLQPGQAIDAMVRKAIGECQRTAWERGDETVMVPVDVTAPVDLASALPDDIAAGIRERARMAEELVDPPAAAEVEETAENMIDWLTSGEAAKCIVGASRSLVTQSMRAAIAGQTPGLGPIRVREVQLEDKLPSYVKYVVDRATLPEVAPHVLKRSPRSEVPPDDVQFWIAALEDCAKHPFKSTARAECLHMHSERLGVRIDVLRDRLSKWEGRKAGCPFAFVRPATGAPFRTPSGE